MDARSPAPLILIVDDDDHLSRLIEESLRRHGYAAATAASGKAAIAWLNQQRADLLLLDLQLPDMSGRDLISRLAESQRLIPFVISSSQGDERVAVEMMKRGALDYLVKDQDFLEFVPVMAERAMRQIEREHKLTVAEEAWRQESALNAAILDTSGALIVVLDSRDCIVRFNHACERTTGYAVEAVRGKCVWDLFRTPAESLEVRKVLARLHAGEFPIRYENHWLTRDGERRRIAWSSTILRDKSGALQHIISSGIDITERHRADLRLGLQYAVTRALADSATLDEAAPVILQAVCDRLEWRFGELWRVDAAAGLLRHVETCAAQPLAAPEFETVTRQITFPPGVGLPGRVWSSGKPAWISDLLRDENFPRARVAAELGLRSGFGFPILHGSEVLGVMVFFSLQSRPLEDDLLPMFANIGTQIGQFIERKRAEQALRDSEERLRTLVQTAGSVIVVLSPDRRVLEWNQEAERVFGWSRPEVLGRDYFQLFMPDEVRNAVVADFEKVLGGQPTRGFENQIVTRAGSQRHLLWNAIRLENGQGGTEGVIAIGQDITERKRLERELLQISELEQRRIGQDLHDGICQELAGIEIMSQVLVEKLGAKARAHAANAAEIARLVRAAISHTRDLARGLSPVVVESEGLMSALEELAAGTEKIFRVKCAFRCPAPVPVHDNAVATHLYRIAQEAVSNALKHGKASAIEIGLVQTPDRIHLRVTDNGCGLPVESPRRGGMGLRIMQYRAGMIGGSLAVRKDAGGGATVVCTAVIPPEKTANSSKP